MDVTTDYALRIMPLVALVRQSFTDTAGAEEGALVGGFVETLLTETPSQDLRVFTALDGNDPIGCICFSRLNYPQDPRRVMLLSPVAVATAAQGKGVGQALIRHGLTALRAEGVDVAITYGDPAYYGKLGFRPIAEDDARPPLPLSQPRGWIGQSLSDSPFTPLKGPSHCVAALDEPTLW